MTVRSIRVLVATSLLIVAMAAADAHAEDCGPRLDAYEDYTIREVDIDGPFPFAGVYRRLLASLRSELPAKGRPLRVAEANAALDRIERRVRDAPTLVDLPANVTAVAIVLRRCDDGRREIDLLYWVFTTRLGAPSLTLGDLNDRSRDDPASVATIADNASRFSLTPGLRYDEADRLVGGAQATWSHGGSGTRVSAEGAASDRYKTAALGVAGARDIESPLLWRAAFGGGYRFEEQPVRGDDVRRGLAFGWISALTRPLGPLRGVAKYALQLEDGFTESTLRSPGFETDTHYRALKVLTGLSGVAGRDDFDLSAAAELGSTDAAALAWYRALVSATYGLRIAPRTPAFDHRALDFHARLVAGWLEPVGDGRAPQAARFFGGVRPRLFTDIPEWPLQASPLIRGYPDNRFYAQLNGDPSGRERFASLSLTAAFTAWRRPLLPKDVYTNPGFLDAIEAGKKTARSNVVGYHESHDPVMKDADGVAAEADRTLAALQQHLSALTVPEATAEALEICQDTVDGTRGTIVKARADRRFKGLANPNAPPHTLLAVVNDCERDLNAGLDDPAIRAATARVQEYFTALTEILGKVDRATVGRKTDEDFALASRAIDAFVHDINLVSVDPVAIFDVAYAGPAVRDTFVRYSVGGGLRLTVGSMVSFTLGYAANPNRGRGEPAGALFFEMRFSDLLR